MTKLDKKIHELHAKRLSFIINEQSAFAAQINRPEFNTILRIELNTLAELEKKLPDDKFEEKLTSTYLVKKFNDLSKEKVKLGENFKYGDDDDLIDNINYLPKYCKNIFKVELDDMVEGKQAKVEAPTNTFKAADTTMDSEDMMDAAAAFNMGAMGFSLDPHENPFILGKANAELGKKIASGEVYQYKNKPKAIPIIKLVLAILVMLTTVGLVLTAVFCFMAHRLPINTSSTEVPVVYLSAITNGVFYLLAAGLGAYAEALTIKSMMKREGKMNDNLLYSFSWPFYISFVALVLLVSLLDLRVTWFLGSQYSITERTGAHWIGYKAWGYSIIALASLAGAILIPTIVGIVKNPKLDKERLNKMIVDYVDEIVKQNGGMPRPVNQTGADVQTPVDVKPSETKKPEPTKDSEPKKGKGTKKPSKPKK